LNINKNLAMLHSSVQVLKHHIFYDFYIVPGSSNSNNESGQLKDQRVWSVAECAQVFSSSLAELAKKADINKDDPLVWDKDDENSMDFVTACANIRAAAFGISQLNRFDIKGM
jgi:ubiquitin-like 1-activating enzyme E1 B